MGNAQRNLGYLFPVVISTVLGSLIIFLVVEIVSFDNRVTEYYTPTILRFESLTESSWQLLRALDAQEAGSGRSSVAASQFERAASQLREFVQGTWPQDKTPTIHGLLDTSGAILAALDQSSPDEAERLLEALLPDLNTHIKEYRQELMQTKARMRHSTVATGALGLAVILLGLPYALRERRLYEMRQRQAETDSALTALVGALDARDPYTKGHSERVAKYAVAIADELGLDKKAKRNLHLAALLHDIGKIGIPDAILRKKFDLTRDERDAVKQHTVVGERILSGIENLADINPAVRHHHERLDGSGYPEGLVGDRIPLPARVIAVADTFDAMTTSRPYREGLSRQEAQAELVKYAGVYWPKQLVEAFIRALEREARPSSETKWTG